MKTKSKRIIFSILIFTLLIFNHACKKTEANSTEASADSSAVTSTDSITAVADSALSTVDSASASVDAVKDAAATVDGAKKATKESGGYTKNSNSFNDYYSSEEYDRVKLNRDTAIPDENKPPANQLQIDNTAENNKIEHIKNIKANTFIYAPENMGKGNSYTVMAMVSMKDIEKGVKSFYEKIEKSNHGSINKGGIKSKNNVAFTNKIKVSLKYDDDIFKVIDSDDGAVKILDENHKELFWKWNVKPKAYCSKSHLIFVFQSMDNDEILFEEEMFVDVNISVPNGIKGYLGYLMDNPQYTFPAMIIPLATFFAGRFFKRKKETDSEQ